MMDEIQRVKNFLLNLKKIIRENRFKKTLHNQISRIVAERLFTILEYLENSATQVLLKALKVKKLKFGFLIGNTYFPINNAGFFSCLSTISEDLAASEIPITKINNSFAMSLYKDKLFRNNWSKFFRPPKSSMTLKQKTNLSSYWNSIYADIDVEPISKISQNWLVLSGEVEALINKSIAKYDVDFEKTIAVHYRGTDKNTEIATPSVRRFLNEVENLLKVNKDLKIFLITDEANAEKAFREKFGDQIVIPDELETAQVPNVGAHHQGLSSPQEHGLWFLAFVQIVSKSKHVVTHTGNGGLWEYGFRESKSDFIQIR